MTYRASGRKSASARRPVGHFTSKECAMNLGINAISLQPLDGTKIGKNLTEFILSDVFDFPQDVLQLVQQVIHVGGGDDEGGLEGHDVSGEAVFPH